MRGGLVLLDRFNCTVLSSLRCINALDNIEIEGADKQSGVDILRRALRTPCSTIAKNGGKDPSIVVEKVIAANSANIGYDALKDKYVDMIQEGMLRLTHPHDEHYTTHLIDFGGGRSEGKKGAGKRREVEGFLDEINI